MAIRVVIIDDGCTGCGLCEDICPEVFSVDDISVVNEGVDLNEYEEGVFAV